MSSMLAKNKTKSTRKLGSALSSFRVVKCYLCRNRYVCFFKFAKRNARVVRIAKDSHFFSKK